jgi:anti-sigma-K factor RskA
VSPDDSRLEPSGCGGDAAPYVLGALNDQETERFRRHLDSCAVCREEVAALGVVVAALPAAAPQLTAPRELKRRVMSAVHSDARGIPATGSSAASNRGTARIRRLRARSAAGLAAAAVALVAVVVIALAQGGGGGVRVITAEVLAPRASALVRLSGGHAELTVVGMPQAAPGRVYQVWIERTGQPRPTDALFTVTSSGDATVGVPGSVSGAKEILVTSEPRGGSRVPTRPPVIVARVS